MNFSCICNLPLAILPLLDYLFIQISIDFDHSYEKTTLKTCSNTGEILKGINFLFKRSRANLSPKTLTDASG